jgi:hypothetical protein
MSGRGNALRGVVLWLHVVWPPWILAVLLLAWLGTEFIYLSSGFSYGNWHLLRPCLYPRDALLIFFAGGYGAYRGLAFHPVLNDSYYDWLSGTPWTRTQPLPLGPIWLVPQDALFVGLLVLLSLHQPAALPAVLPLTFLGSFIAASTLAQAWTGPTWSVYVLLAGLIAVMRASIVSPGLGLLAALPLAGLLFAVQWLALAQFPWTQRLARIRSHVLQNEVVRQTHKFRAPAGESPLREIQWLWPLNRLAADLRPPLLTRLDHGLLNLLTGLLVYTLAVPVPDHPDFEQFVRMACLVTAGGAAAIRLVSYVKVHRPPFGILGRWATGQWIIPGYDVVFLTPLATLATGASVHFALHRLDVPPAVTLGVSLTAILLVALLGGPERRKWQLTCPCRLVYLGGERRLVEEI